MLAYLLNSAACMAILLLFYKLFLEKENMHHFKRFYLLGALITSFIVPSLVFMEYVEPKAVLNTAASIQTVTQTTQIVEATTDIDVINWSMLLWNIYFLGLLGFGFRFIKHLFQIINRIKANPKLKHNFSIKVLLQESLPPHTFFSYIFLNKAKFEANTIPKAVLAHEETHAKQYHSLDVLFIEFLQVLFWFNPCVYFFKKSIKLNHEFLADSAVLKKEKSTSHYQNTLLSYLSQESLYNYQSTGIANTFNYSSTRLTVLGKTFTFGSAVGQVKKRFTVMKKRTSKKSIALRSFLILPLIALLLLGFSEKKLIERENISPIVNESALPLENINIRIDNEGRIFFQNEKLISLENLETQLLDLNNSLSKEKRKQFITAIIKVASNSPENVLKKVTHILAKYGVAQIDILDPKPGYSGNQIETKTGQSEIKKYNTLAKRYNAIPIAKRKIPLKDLNVLETIYKQMTKSQRKEAQPFPECLPKNIQDGASRKQMAEYNKLAKYYNDMSKNNRRILRADVERLEYIYRLMSDKQKADAEPFPDFPEPPPAPKAPNTTMEPKTNVASSLNFPAPPRSPKSSPSLNTTNYANQQLKEIIENQDPYDVVGTSIKVNPNSPQPFGVFNGELSKTTPPSSPRALKGKAISIPAPPLPPEPVEPLDYIIDMAKKGATFYYEKKEISSDKAIELMKNNNSINIDSRSKNGTPIVRLSKEPITID